MVSGDTVALLRDLVDVYPRGSFAVRGRSHTVDVFELLGVHAPGWQLGGHANRGTAD